MLLIIKYNISVKIKVKIIPSKKSPQKSENMDFCTEVLWIRDILVQIQIHGSVPLTYGSGSEFGSGTCFIVSGWQDANKKYGFISKFFKVFFAYYRYFLMIHLHKFPQIKSLQKKSQDSRNQGFSYFFFLLMEGSGSGSRSDSLQNKNGSGSGPSKNIRIQIHNTAAWFSFCGLIWPSCTWLRVRIPTPNPLNQLNPCNQWHWFNWFRVHWSNWMQINSTATILEDPVRQCCGSETKVSDPVSDPDPAWSWFRIRI